MPPRLISVYVDYRLDNGIPFYVGKGVTNRVRSFKRNQMHTRIVAKHGMRREIVFETLSNEEAIILEIKLIKELKTRDTYGGANFTDGGEGTLGWNPSDETRKKMSEKRRARVITSETRQKMSESHKKRFKDPAEHTKVSESFKRVWSDPDFHQRMSKARTGEGNSQSKITEVDVLKIRRQYDQLDVSVRGVSSQFLHATAMLFNVTPENIWGIVKRKSWKHLP